MKITYIFPKYYFKGFLTFPESNFITNKQQKTDKLGKLNHLQFERFFDSGNLNIDFHSSLKKLNTQYL